MKRRNFLSLLGGAASAPFLPLPTLAQTGYSAANWQTAVAAARGSAALSVGGMAARLGLSTAAAEALMRDMVKQGLIGPLSAPRHGGVWAVSRIMKAGNIAALHAAQKVAPKSKHWPHDDKTVQEEVPAWLSHLRSLCTKQGIELHPRCYG